MPNRGSQFILASCVLLAAGGLAAVLVLTRQALPQEEQPQLGPIVQVVTAERSAAPVVIQGYGEVRPVVRTRIVPQVPGRVIRVHPELHAGGFIPAGEPLMVIDPADFELALRRAEAERAAAEAARRSAESRIAEARTNLAEAEEELRLTEDLLTRDVARQREVQRKRVTYEVAMAALHTAEAAMSSAEADIAAVDVRIEQTKLDLQRTQLNLPFDAVIVEESVNVGQQVSAGQDLGEVYGTSAVEIPVPLMDRDLAWLENLPLSPLRSASDPQTLPMAEVTAEFAGLQCTWYGRAVRTEGQVDRRSRMVRVVVRVEDPFEATEHRPPLMPGAFVRVGIEGRTLRDVIALPRLALRPGGTIWVAGDDEILHIRPVQIAHQDRQKIYLSGGLEAGEQVILTPLDTVTEGMRIRLPTDRTPAAASLPGILPDGPEVR